MMVATIPCKINTLLAKSLSDTSQIKHADYCALYPSALLIMSTQFELSRSVHACHYGSICSVLDGPGTQL